ncbi:hypothetical protein YN1HA_18040 [Sulfurisphaera ohwakuensis]
MEIIHVSTFNSFWDSSSLKNDLLNGKIEKLSIPFGIHRETSGIVCSYGLITFNSFWDSSLINVLKEELKEVAFNSFWDSSQCLRCGCIFRSKNFQFLLGFIIG